MEHAEDQDKPDLDAFAERLGVSPEGEEPAGAAKVTDADAAQPRWQPQWQHLGVPVVICLTTVFLLRLRRRR